MKFQIAQVDDDVDEAPVLNDYDLEVKSWDWLARLLIDRFDPSGIHPRQVWIEELDENGDLTDRRIALLPADAIWLVSQVLGDSETAVKIAEDRSGS